MKGISIIGSTGSIGTQALDVIDEQKNYEVICLCCNSNIELLEEQIRKYRPHYAVVMEEAEALKLRNSVRDTSTKVLAGYDGIIEGCTTNRTDLVINSSVGIAGLRPTLEIIKHKKNIGLANKETLVTAGGLVNELCRENGVKLFPIDSEHSAIFQCLQGNEANKIEKIILTASGGPFRGYTKEQLKNISVEQALKHPNWVMGNKITIDSATLMNKGLEVIEAKWLFDVSVDQIEVVVHPESIVHSAVQYEDGSIIAQMGLPDMRLPIQYAMNYPNRTSNKLNRFDFFGKSLNFDKPDIETFKCLKLAFAAGRRNDTVPAVLNGANEALVALFLKKKIAFNEIGDIVESAIKAHKPCDKPSIEDIIKADEWSREYVNNAVR